ncbi:putative toxin-antitoxin system toxin component, PIN family [Candidatus Woesearchaeota archaeon]|nr:putative toxin-antitoxin system toxin component, PIN family [Candidatus Woesearchaeota archaeon]
MGKKKIVLDTNIYISALGWKGNPRIILSKIIEGKYELLLSVKQFEEVVKVLDYPKFGFTDEQKARFILLLNEIATMVKTKTKVDVIKDDPSDNIVLESVAEFEIDYVVSGDRHLLDLKEFNGAKIITPKQFMQIVNQK